MCVNVCVCVCVCVCASLYLCPSVHECVQISLLLMGVDLRLSTVGSRGVCATGRCNECDRLMCG